MLDVQPDLQADIPGIDVEAQVSRQWYEGIALVQQMLAEWNPLVPLPAHLRLDALDPGYVRLQIRLHVEHDRVTDRGDVSAHESRSAGTGNPQWSWSWAEP